MWRPLLVLSTLALIFLWPGRPLAAARPGEVRLLLAPPLIALSFTQVEQQEAIAEVQVQVLAPPRQPWRLLLQVMGPALPVTGRELPTLDLRWSGRPAGLFREGALTLAGPQVIAQGQGPASGVLGLRLHLPLAAGAGHWRQRLLFLLESL